MKKILAFILCFIPVVALGASDTFEGQTGTDTFEGQTTTDTIEGVVRGSGGGGSCSTYTSADVLNEGFIGTGFEESGWTTSNGNSLLNEDYDSSALTTNKPDSDPANPCNEALRTDLTDGGSGDSESWYTNDLGSGYTNITITVTIYVLTLGDLDYFSALVFSDNSLATEPSKAHLRIQKESGTDSIRVYGDGDDTGYDAMQSGWNTIIIDMNRNASSSVTLNGSGVGNFTMYDYDVRYVHVGAPLGVSSDDDIDYVVGDIHIEDDDS
jgi:hypothetical protein